MHDLIELRTAMIMYKANTQCLPADLQTMFDMTLERIHDNAIVEMFDRCLRVEKSITVHGINRWYIVGITYYYELILYYRLEWFVNVLLG